MSDESYGRIFLQLVPRIGLLRRRGLAGWAILFGGVIVTVLAIMTIAAPFISPYNPIDINVGPILSPPSSQFPLGTNHLGQDMLSRVISGGAIMFQVSILSVLVCLLVGVPIGLFASFRGGFTDKVASLVMDSLYAFPGLVLRLRLLRCWGLEWSIWPSQLRSFMCPRIIELSEAKCSRSSNCHTWMLRE